MPAPNKESYRIMGIDPGTNYMGYGVVEVTGRELHSVVMGAIDLHKLTDPYAKLRRIFDRVGALVDEYAPREVALESPFFGENVQSMLKLGRAQGVAIAAAISRDVPVHEYAPMKIKMSITGNGQSSKEQVAGILKRMLHLREEDTVSFLDATDALAAAYCHALQDMRPQCMQGATVPVRSWSAFVRQNKERVSTPKSTVITSAVCKKS